MVWLKVFIAIHLFSCIKGTSKQLQFLEPEYREWYDTYQKLLAEINANPEYSEALAQKIQLEEHQGLNNVPFNCEVELSETPPTSVHRLRPSDIQIVASLGDSITAGFGLRAQNIAGIVVENRGESWSAGSDRQLEHNAITLPNILKKFNRNLQGSSICNRYPGHPYMNWFNVAISGATSRNLASQAWTLIDRLRADNNIDFWRDWKLITILIGCNDLCRWCFQPAYLPHNYAASVRDALDILQDHIPRALVNLVIMPDPSMINHVNSGAFCTGFQQAACFCAVSNWTEATGQTTDDYYYELQKVVDTGRYDIWDDFTVVLQPHMRDLYPDVFLNNGQSPEDFFAPDCFHPSRKGQQQMAFLLWTTMMTPVGEKPFKWFPKDIMDGYKCPTKEHPYIFTNINSDSAVSTTNPGAIMLYLVVLLGIYL